MIIVWYDSQLSCSQAHPFLKLFNLFEEKASYRFSTTRIINSIKKKQRCKILDTKWATTQKQKKTSLIRVFAVRMKKPWVLERTGKTLIRLGRCPDWPESSLGDFVGFIMRQLKLLQQNVMVGCKDTKFQKQKRQRPSGQTMFKGFGNSSLKCFHLKKILCVIKASH